MAKIFEFNKGQIGTLIDSVSKTKGTLTVGTSRGFVKTEKGLALEFDSNTTKVAITETTYQTSETVSFVFAAKKTDVQTNKFVFLGNSNVSSNSHIALQYDAGLKLKIESDTNGDQLLKQLNVVDSNWHLYIIVILSGAVSMYQDNILLGTGTLIDNLTIDSIGFHQGQYSKGYISSIVIYNKALSTQERNNIYKQFLIAGGNNPNKDNLNYPKPTIDNDPNVLAHYNMIPSGNLLVNIRGTGLYNGAISGGVVKTKDGMGVYKTNKDITLASSVTISRLAGSISMRLKINSYNLAGSYNNNNYILNSNIQGYKNLYVAPTPFLRLESNTNGDFWTSLVTPPIGVYFTLNINAVNGTVSTYINGTFIESQTPTDNISFDKMFGSILDSAIKSDCEISDIIFKNNYLTVQQIKNYHNQFIHPTFIETWEGNGADGTTKLPRGFEYGTGTYKIGELTTYVSKDLEVGTQYLQFVTAGTIKKAINLDNYVNNGYITYDYFNGATWATRSGLINAPVTGVAYSNRTLTFTGTNIGDRIGTIKVYNGVKV